MNSGLINRVCGGCLALAILGAAPLASMSRAQDATKDATKAAKDAMKDATKSAKDAMNDAKDAAKKQLDGVKDAAKQAEGGMTAEEMEAGKRYEEYAAVGEHHKYLAKFEGEWDVATKFYMEPGAPAMENKLSCSTKLIMGGRYLVEKVTGNLDMGTGPIPFEGVSTTGYDNHKKVYFSTWIDNMGTGIMHDSGTMSADGKTITLEGKAYNPAVGEELPTKNVSTLIDANTRKFEMWGPGPDGKMFKTAEMTYTRRKK